MIYSLLKTAKANSLEPQAWLRQVLNELPAAKTVDDMDVLIPWHVTKLLLKPNRKITTITDG